MSSHEELTVLPEDLYPRTKFWAAAAPLVLATDAGELARRQVASIVDLLGLERGDAVLDLQCAANGQVAIELARRGLAVTALAFNPALGNLVTQRASTEDVSVRVVVATDDHWADEIGAVAAILDVGSPFGIVDGAADPVHHLTAAVGRLEPGGRLAALTMGAEVALRDYVGRDWYEDGDRLVLLEAEPVDSWTRLEHRWRIYEGGAHSDLQFSHRLLTGRQLRNLLQSVGLATCDIHGCRADGTVATGPYDRDTDRLLAVGRR